MKSGVVALDVLMKYAQKDDPSGESLCGGSKLGRKYGDLAKNVTTTIADEQGFYLWGKYKPNGLWINIYLGKAGYGKTAHLRARILEELKDERQFLWHPIFLTENELLAKGEKYYPSKWATYKNHWKRAILKTGASHIIWVATPGLDGPKVPDIEKDLIETLNPTANLMRAAPPSSLQPFTKKVIECFRSEIHKSRVMQGNSASANN